MCATGNFKPVYSLMTSIVAVIYITRFLPRGTPLWDTPPSVVWSPPPPFLLRSPSRPAVDDPRNLGLEGDMHFLSTYVCSMYTTLKYIPSGNGDELRDRSTRYGLCSENSRGRVAWCQLRDKHMYLFDSREGASGVMGYSLRERSTFSFQI